MLHKSEIKKIGTRKNADSPSTATLNWAPGTSSQSYVSGTLTPVAQKAPTPDSPTAEPKTARSVVRSCPLFDERGVSQPMMPLAADMAMPNSTNDSLITALRYESGRSCRGRRQGRLDLSGRAQDFLARGGAHHDVAETRVMQGIRKP